jgi:hypothetical protein
VAIAPHWTALRGSGPSRTGLWSRSAAPIVVSSPSRPTTYSVVTVCTIGEPNRMMLPSGSMTTPSCWPQSVSSGTRYVRSGQTPSLSQFVSVVNPDVGRASDGAGDALGHLPEVNLDAIACCEAVASALVLAYRKPEPLVVRERGSQIADWEDRCNSLQRSRDYRIISCRSSACSVTQAAILSLDTESRA